MKKRGQLKLSFGMIFSIILIIVFIAFAIYAVIKFINIQRTVEVESFKNDLQDDVTAVWQSSGEYSQDKEYYLPDKIDEVCFIDDEYENMYFKPVGVFDGELFDHVDVDEFCVDNVEGKVSLTLVKDYGETSVRIE